MKRVQPSMAELAEKIASQFVLARAGRGPQLLANMKGSMEVYWRNKKSRASINMRGYT